ncbi:Vacuolar protein sorting-associated protein 13D [Chionoecetes opilio]|uniref:Vacuolar protein sorting-associated protein 13D n=1 Tax=Chionoecetes opilio TaxID=41210 RepID=A0A8J8WAY3_CHIOP|nr:Vacuolar protein sorting-associated protein 13D [Chionoecetes opilio]
MKKLRSKSPSWASAIRAADERLVSDMDRQMARWAEYFGQLFTVDLSLGQHHTTGLWAVDADPPIDETASSLDEVSYFSRGSRVSLDISAGSPVIFLPMSSQSNDLLVGDLGSITVMNTFLWAGSEGTIKQAREVDAGPQPFSIMRLRQQGRHSEAAAPTSTQHSNFDGNVNPENSSKPHKCLLDVMFVSLVNMDIHTGTRSPTQHSQYNHKQLGRGNSSSSEEKHSKKRNRGGKKEEKGRKSRKNASVGEVEWVFGSYMVRRCGTSLLHDKCALELQVERNLDTAISHAGP